MIHYIYKIVFLRGFPCGRYYLGKRSYNGKDLINDKYTGSGLFCNSYFRKYGKVLGDTYLKEIIEINPSKQINQLREAILIGDKGKTDPLCMNLKPGGDGGSTKGFTGKKILQYDINLNFIRKGNSITEASEKLNISDGSLGNVCNHRQHSAGGYIGCYENEKPSFNKKTLQNGPRKIKQFDKFGKFVKEFNSIKLAAEHLNIKGQNIQACCNRKTCHCNGYIGRFSEDDSISKKDIEKVLKSTKKFKIYQIDDFGNIIKEYNTIKQAAKENKISIYGIRESIVSNKRKYGYYGKRIEI